MICFVERITSDHTKLLAKEEDRNHQLQSACKSVEELRHQLEISKKEIDQYVAKLGDFERNIAQYREERNRAYDERDHLHTFSESLRNKLEDVTQDRKFLQEKLKTAIDEKCKAVLHSDSVNAKETELEIRERQMESEMNLLRSKAESLTESLNKALADNHTFRQNVTQQRMQLESDLLRVTKEREFSQKEIEMLTQRSDGHEQQSKELIEKLHASHIDLAKRTEYFELELESQRKLADLYKSSEDENKAMISELSEGMCSVLCVC